jgi:hypothetical protein
MENPVASTGTSSLVWMVALMVGICLLMPLSFIVLSAVGAPVLLTVGVVAALLLLCVFSHRFMKH